MMFILDRDFKILASASNESRNTLHYYDDKIHSELKSGVSTFSFTVSKAQEDSKHIQEGNFVTLTNNKGKQLLFTVIEIEEDTTKKMVYCEDIGLDLLNEAKPPTKAEAQPIAYYVNEVLADSGWEIGTNEIAHLARSLEYTSFANSLERLLSICNGFDEAELDFTVDFDGNTIAHQYVNIYKRRGKDTGIRLNAGIDLVNARRTVSLDTLATALYGVGAEIQTGDENAVKQYVDFRSITYDDGRFYQWNGYILDRESNKQWSRYRKESATKGFIVDYYSYDTDSPQELFNRTLSQLKKRCEPAVTYEVEIVELDKDLSIGDTITVVDSEFNPPLYLSARVLTIDESETTPEMNKLTLGNYVLLKPSIDEQLIELQKTLEETRKSWSSQNQPVLSVESTNGEAFFDDNVNTILQAKILRGGIVITSSYADSAFIWTKKDRLGNTVAGWSRTGKNLPISYTDVLDKATFICAVAGMQAQTTLFNTLTTVRKTTAPSNPQQGQSWIDTSVTPSVHKIYLSGEWKLVTPVSGEEFTEVKELANTNMQGIVAVNTEVSKKVNTTTYTSKVSAIESALANKLETAVANATKIAQDAEIAKKVAQTAYDAKVVELNTAIGTKLDTATATATKLAQDAEIAKKVAQTTYNAKVLAIESTLSNKLDTATANATKAAQDIEIAKKVAQTAYDTKVSALESTLATKLDTATANTTKIAQDAEIAKKVAQTAYNTKVSELDSAISGHTTRIEATETGLLAKASTTEVNALKTRMSTAETSLTTNASEIALKATQTDLDTVEGRMDTAEASLTVHAGQIASKVAQTTFDAANVRLGAAESTITQQATQIASKVATTTYNAGIATKEDSIVKATTAPAHLNGKLWLNTSVTPNVLNRSTGSAWVKVTPTTAAEVGAYSTTDGSNLATRVTTAETTITQQGNQIALKASQTDLNTATGRLNTAESTLMVQAGQITSKVAQTEFNAVESRLDTAESSITQQAGEIASKVAQTTYEADINTPATGLKAKVSSAESTITQQATLIASKVSQTDFNAAKSRLDTAESTITQQAGQIASKVSQTTYDSGIATKEDSIVKATIAPAHLNGKLWLNTSVTPNVLNRSTGSAWVKATPTTAGEVGAYSSADGTTLAGRVTTTETTITQQGNQIALKATQTGLDSTNTRLTTAEGTLTVQAGQIASKVAQTDFNAVSTRLVTAESTITQQATQIASKVAQTDFDAVEGRMDTAESTITQQATQIASKVATTTYNSGIASKENSIVKATTAPAHVSGLLWLNTSVTPNVLNRSTGTAWVKVTPTTASEVGAYSSTDGSTLAGRVTTAESTIIQQGNSIALKASQTELNTLDGRMDTAESTLTVQAGQIASKVSQTEFNAVEGRVDSAESTITQQATQIASKVSQAAYDTDINTATTGLKAKVSVAESTITQQATQIASKVSQTDFNAVNTRLGTAESTITQQAGEIASKVATTTYNSGIAAKEDSITKATTAPAHLNGRLWLNTSVTPNVLNRSTGTAWVKVTPTTAGEVGAYSSTDGSSLATRVSSAETTITQQGNQIALKATQTDLDAAKGRLTTAEGTLTVQATQIASKVAQTDFNAVKGRMDTAESTITQQATQIASKVSQTDFNAANTRLGTAESTITQQATQIASKVATTTYNSGIAAKEDSIVKATTAPAHASGKLWLNTSVTPNVLNRSTGTAWVKVTPTTAAEVGAYSTTDGSSLAGRVSTAESTIVQQGSSIALKASQTDLNAIDGRLDTAEASLVVQAGQISTKVESTTYNTKMGALDTAIGTKANASDVSALTTRVTTAESNITQNANGIALRATKTEAQTYATTAKTEAVSAAATDATNKANGALGSAKTYADTKVNGIKIGGRNLLLASDIEVTNSSYPTKTYYLSEKMVEGEIYTVKIWGTLGAGKTSFAPYLNGGSISLGALTNNGDGTFSKTFTGRDSGVTTGDFLNIYPISFTTVVNSTITKIKLEKGNIPTYWTPAPEDIDAVILGIESRVTNAESAITADAITNTVMGTTAFNAKMAEYATEEALGGYATTGALDGVKGTSEAARDAISNLDLTPYVKTTQVEQLENSINTRISQSGGVNLLRNSIGWKGTDFWTNVSGTMEAIQTPQLETFGYGAGFYKKHAAVASRINQTVNLPMAGTYTLSFRMNKSIETAVTGKYSACGIYVDNLPFFGKGTGSGLTNGFEEFFYTFTTTKITADISVAIGELAEATISGLMLNIGDKPLQWSNHSTEIYNTHVRMDINGIQVMGNRDGSKTVITPDEFSGYENGERIFTLNGDTTEVKKLKAEEQFEMAPITIVTVDNATYRGWAFI